MKYLFYALSISLSMALLSCTCNDDDSSRPEACSHTPPTDELCDAYFERWFYNQETNTCSQIGYSGCNVWGFESKEECEACE